MSWQARRQVGGGCEIWVHAWGLHAGIGSKEEGPRAQLQKLVGEDCPWVGLVGRLGAWD